MRYWNTSESRREIKVTLCTWWAILADARADAVFEDFRGKDCAFVANWLRGKGTKTSTGNSVRRWPYPTSKKELPLQRRRTNLDWPSLQKEANRCQSSAESKRNKSEEEAMMISFLLIFIALVSLALNSCSMLYNHTVFKISIKRRVENF